MAALIEALAPPDTVLISAATHRLVQGSFTTEDLGHLTLTGVSPLLGLPRTPDSSFGQLVTLPSGGAYGGADGRGQAPTAEVRQQDVAKTDRVPLFVEELTKMVVESGLLQEREDHCQALTIAYRLPAAARISLNFQECQVCGPREPRAWNIPSHKEVVPCHNRIRARSRSG